MKTIDVTPKWAGILPLIIEAVKNGSEDAMSELKRMARIADEYVSLHKKTDEFATFNSGPHTFVRMTEDNETVSILTKSGRQITVAVIDGANCADVCLHNGDHEPENNGRADIPAFEIIGFKTGATPVPRTRVTLATVLFTHKKREA